jgi:hypothetical protein
MEAVIKFGDAYCYLKEFVINGIKADMRDFGEKRDVNPKMAEPYGCGDMRFIPNLYPTEAVLQKYDIDEEEYDTICSQLQKGLSFGKCGWCV